MACINDFYIKKGVDSIDELLKMYIKENPTDKMGWYTTNFGILTYYRDKENDEKYVCSDTFDKEFETMGINELATKYEVDSTIGGKRRKKNKRTRTKRRLKSLNKKRQSRKK